MIRKSTAVWNGTGQEGKGTLTSASGILSNTPYSAGTRFGNENGTNPEELIAAAHAGCFSMALAFQLTGAGFTPNEIKTDACVKVEFVDGAPKIQSVHLTVVANIPNISEEKFLEIAEGAKNGCPVSKALTGVEIALKAELN